MFAHSEASHNSLDENINDCIADISEESEECITKENQRHLCQKKCSSKDGLFVHLQKEHGEYYNGMLEVAARLNIENILNDLARLGVSHRPIVWPDLLIYFM